MLDFQKGNPASFESLMHKYYKRLFNFIYRFVGSREAAEDLTQEVFLKVYKAVGGYQPQSKFQTWIYTIARNLSLNELRRAGRKNVSLDEPVSLKDGEGQRQVSDESAENPAESIAQEDTRRMVQEAIASLPETQRTAVILRRYDNMSYEEIAKTMGTSVEAVKSLLNRAKENLKDRLTRPPED